MCDDDLRLQLANDLDGAFEHLVLAYQHRLFAFALRISAQPQDAEEIVQDALVRAYRALATYPAERISALSVRAWLFQITLNVARNRLRGQRVMTTTLASEHDEGVDTPAPTDAQPEVAAEHSERARELEAELRRLPDRYRASVVLRHVQGLGYSEIAAITGQPEGTVKANVHRGVRLLRTALAQTPLEVR